MFSQPISNLKGQHDVESSNTNDQYHEQAKAITTIRSGKEVDNKVECRGDDELVRSPERRKSSAASPLKRDSPSPSPS